MSTPSLKATGAGLRQTANGQRLLNVGCGNRFHLDWNNVDLVASDPAVRSHNVLKGLPFEASSFDAVYCSHFLEHLASTTVEAMLAEFRRVLKPKGVVRIVVP